MARLFFAYSLQAPWPSELPQGRVVQPEMRHCTLAFVGESKLEPLLAKCQQLPKPSSHWGFLGSLANLVFLPEKHARVAAYEIAFEESIELNAYYQQLHSQLVSWGYALEQKAFYPHVTLARAPFDRAEWTKLHMQIPVWTSALHLYESLGNLEYISRWQQPFALPYEEISHTADSAFLVYGDSPWRLYLHAAYAISTLCPAMLAFFNANEGDFLHSTTFDLDALEAVITTLNRWVTRADIEIGVPIKAVSYHMHFEKRLSDVAWEMIIDV